MFHGVTLFDCAAQVYWTNFDSEPMTSFSTESASSTRLHVVSALTPGPSFTLNDPLFAFPMAVLRPWTTTTSSGSLRPAADPHSVLLRSRLGSRAPGGDRCPERTFNLSMTTTTSRVGVRPTARCWFGLCPRQTAALPCLKASGRKARRDKLQRIKTTRGPPSWICNFGTAT